MKRLLIWGTGAQAQKLVEHLANSAIQVMAFVDSNPARHGLFHEKPVIAPEAAAQLVAARDYDLLVIASVFHAEILQKALDLGIAPEIIASSASVYFRCYSSVLTEEHLSILCTVPWWYHAFEILPGVTTPGVCNFKPWLLEHPLLADLSGQRALDIGAWDGPYTLEMARRGAKVTAFDIQPPSHSGFDVTCRVNTLETNHICANVYSLNPTDHGIFDLVTFFGVYYHLKNPLAALSNINAVLKIGGLVLVEGAILEGAPLVDTYWAERVDTIELLRDIPMGYYVKSEYEGELSNWWVPNQACLRHWLESSGFEVLQISIVEHGTRGFCIARKIAGIPQEHFVLSPASERGKDS
jgi:tRNA (mo5U34)-methyltransferase